MKREPPASVIKALRSEVNFGCPVPGCGSPYLQWHHFDPPWHVEEHHRVEGMIALCSLHHDQADTGAFSVEQLKSFKQNPYVRGSVAGEFHWRRNKFAVIVGTNIYYDCRVLLQIHDQEMIWFSEDDNGFKSLNINANSLLMRENVWMSSLEAVDIKCPPSGKSLRVDLPNKDRIEISFREIESYERLIEIYKIQHERRHNWPGVPHPKDIIEFPLTVVELTLIIESPKIQINNNKIYVGGHRLNFHHCFFGRADIAFQFGFRKEGVV